MADIAELGLSVRSDGVVTATHRLDGLEKQSRQTERATDKLTRETDKSNSAMKSLAVATAATAAAFAAFRVATSALDTFVKATANAERGQAQLAAGLKSTAGASGQTVASLNAHAAALQKVTNVGDEATNVAQGLLLTFTQISGETFPRATAAVLDLSERMGTDLTSSALQVGKALNDPVLGMTALSRSGIQFTDVQKDMVKELVASNDMLGAQSIILKELESQFGGSAEAARNTLGGALTSLGNAWGDLFEISGPATENLRLAIEDLITAIQDPAFVAFIQTIGTSLVDAMTSAVGVLQFFADNAGTVQSVLIGVGAALTVTMIPALVGATAATTAFTLALATNPVFLFATAVGALTAAIVHYQNTQNVAANATRDAVQAYEANGLALGDATAQSQGYTAALRNQIAMQVEAARTANTLAISVWSEAADRAEGFNSMFGARFTPLEFDRNQKFASVSASTDALFALEKQLEQVDANLKSVETSTGGVTAVTNTSAGVTSKATEQVEKQSKALTEAENSAQDLANTLEQTLGSALSSLFSGPITDLDDALDGILGSFASLGQQNLSGLFSGMFSPANDNGAAVDLLSPLSHAVEQGAQKGTQAGSMKGIASVLGSQGAGYLSAGVGGLGIGYQTESPVMGALGGALSGFAAGGPIGAVIGGIGGLIGGIMGMNKAIREAQEKLENVRGEIDKFNAAANGETVSKYASILDDATAKAGEYIKLAEKARDLDTVAAVEQSLLNLPGTLATEFGKELEASLNALRGNEYLNEVAAAQELYNSRLEDAELLGVDASLAFDELRLSLMNIATESDLTRSQLDSLRMSSGLLGDALAGVQSGIDIANLKRGVQWAEANVASARADLVKSYEAEESAIKSTADATRKYFDSLRQFRDNLLLDSKLSPLNPFERMQTAQSKFQETAALAINGDQDALGRLEDVSRDYLNEARDYYGTSETYFSVFNQVKSVLDQSLTGLESQLTEDQKQLAELQTQSALLAGVNGGVLSVAQAVANLASATSMLANAQSKYDSATGFSDQVTKLYQDILGRAPDASGAAYWQSRIDAGVSGQELIHNFMSGVQSGDTIKASAIAQYGLPGYANGTTSHPGGLAWVGEQGRELLNLPRGSQVIPHEASMRIAGNNDNGSNRELVAEIRALRAEVRAVRETAAAGANMVASAASGTTNAVQRQTDEQKRMAGARSR